MKIVIFHYGWLKKAEIPNGSERNQRTNFSQIRVIKNTGCLHDPGTNLKA
jgi:hypothetical protein